MFFVNIFIQFLYWSRQDEILKPPKQITFVNLKKNENMNVVIAQVKKNNDADLIARFIRMLKGKAKVMTEQEWEDYVLGLMALESEKEGGTVPREEISRFLKKNGIDF